MTSDPQVIVNPFSLVAPGIFRDIFQMTAMDPTIQVRDNAPQASVDDSARVTPPTPSRTSSPSDKPKSKSKQAKAKKTAPKAEAQVDGWSSTTTAH